MSYRSICRKVAQRRESAWENRRRSIPYRDSNSPSYNAPPWRISGTSASVCHPSPRVRSTFSDTTRSSCSSCRLRARSPPSCPSRSPVSRFENEERGNCRRSCNCYRPGLNRSRVTPAARTPSRERRLVGALLVSEKCTLYGICRRFEIGLQFVSAWAEAKWKFQLTRLANATALSFTFYLSCK